MHTLFPVHFSYYFHPRATIRSQLPVFQSIFLINTHPLQDPALQSPLTETTLQICCT